MLFTVTFSLSKEEVQAIGKTLLPTAKPEEIVGSATPLVNEWIRTTIGRKVRELMEKKDADTG